LSATCPNAFGMQVGPHRGIRLHLLDLDTVGVCERIMANARHLPWHFSSADAPSNLELVTGDFVGDIRHECGTHRGELITEVSIQCLKPIGHADECLHGAIKHRDSVINILHVGRFHEGMGQILVLWIQRMVDPECACAFEKDTGHVRVTVEIPGPGEGDIVDNATNSYARVDDAISRRACKASDGCASVSRAPDSSS
jgi:hypothetical protein